MSAAARLLLACALAAAGAGAGAASAQAAAPVRVGVSLGLTGKYADFARVQERGFRLWERDVNARGGVLGRPVRLEVRDDGSSPARAREIYGAMTGAERLDFVFAPFSSEITAAVAPVTGERGYPLIASGASSDSLWQGSPRRLYGLFSPASKLALTFLEMALLRDLGSVGVVHAADPFSRLVAEGSRTWAGRLGMGVALFEALPPDPGRYAELGRRAAAAGVRALLVCGYLEEAVAVPRAFRGAGYDGAIWLPVGLGLPRLYRELGPLAEGLFSTSQSGRHGRDRDPAEVAFTAAYLALHGEEPSHFAATAYAAGELFERAAVRAGTLERDALAGALGAMETQTVLGRYGVDRTGLQVRHVNLVVQVQRGKVTAVWPEAQASAPPVLP